MTHHKAEYINRKPEKNDFAKKNQPFKRRERRAPKKITASYLHNAGLYYLERFAASKKHFKTVMLRKVKRSCMHHTEQNYEDCVKMVDDLADKFEKCGLLNDQLYTDSLTSSLRRKGLSRSGIISKMIHKGISKEQTIQALEKLDCENHENTEEAEKAAALKLARKKKIGPFFIGDEQNIKKSLGVLARAGFSYNIAIEIVNMSLEDENCENLLI